VNYEKNVKIRADGICIYAETSTILFSARILAEKFGFISG